MAGTIVRVYENETRVIIYGYELFGPIVAQAEAAAEAAADAAEAAEDAQAATEAIAATFDWTLDHLNEDSPPDTFATLSDEENGRIPLLSDDEGVTQTVTLEAENLNSVPVGHYVLTSQLLTSAGVVFPFDVAVNESTGQSLAGGETATDILTDASRFGDKMWNGGVREYEAALTSLIPHVETVTGTAGETPCAGTVEYIRELLCQKHGVRPDDHSHYYVSWAPGAGSTTIADHQKPGALYTRKMAALTALVAEVPGLTVRKFTVKWRHGQTAPSPSTYAADLLALVADDNADTKAITGQTEDVYYVCDQPQNVDVALQINLAAEMSPLVVIANPIYWLEKPDGVHFNAESSKWDGAYAGIADVAIVNERRTFRWVRPAKDADGDLICGVDGTSAWVEIELPDGGELVFDTETPPYGEVRQYGCYLFDNDGVTELTVRDLKIIAGPRGKNRIWFDTTAAIVDPPIFRYGFTDPTTHNLGLGNVRSNYGDAMIFKGLDGQMQKPMHQFLVLCEAPFP